VNKGIVWTLAGWLTPTLISPLYLGFSQRFAFFLSYFELLNSLSYFAFFLSYLAM
jgi:hypothetical protein